MEFKGEMLLEMLLEIRKVFSVEEAINWVLWFL